MSNPGQQPPSPPSLPPIPNPTVANAYWHLNGERLKFTSQIQADYGKWLIVTVTSVHLAALYMVSQPGVPEAVRTNPMSYWPFIIGICAILIAGLITWANWTMAASIYMSWMNAWMLVDFKYWPKDAPRWKQIVMPITFWVSLIIGLGSAFCLPWGAYEILKDVKPTAAAITTPAPAPSPAPSKPAETKANPVVNPGRAPEKSK
ncbi:MAG TPA: hypothetical protein VG821_12460 [Rhizomicrobium sp.]|nr:hypothetical protein [Rhizomicrobium sp.]